MRSCFCWCLCSQERASQPVDLFDLTVLFTIFEIYVWVTVSSLALCCSSSRSVTPLELFLTRTHRDDQTCTSHWQTSPVISQLSHLDWLPYCSRCTIKSILPIEEISLRPELSSPPRFRFQGGYPERYKKRRTNKGRKSLCLI